MERLAHLLTLVGAVTAVPSVAWVFESEAYTDELRTILTKTKWQVYHCGGGPDTCPGPRTGDANNVLAVIGRVDSINLSTTAPNLRLAQSPTYFHTDGSKVPARAAIAVTDWWPAHGNEQIAEFVIAAIFDDLYRLRHRAAAFRACAFEADAAAECTPALAATNHSMVSDLTIGVLGYGRIGIQVATRAAALGSRVIATKRRGPFTPTPPGLAYREADVVVSCVPFSAAGLVNASALALMRPHALFVPISAGPVDYGALLSRLEAVPSFRATLDLWPHGCWHFPNVTCGAPLGAANWPTAQEHARLGKLPNVLPLPGMAMRDAHFWRASVRSVADNLDRLSRGEPLLHVVRNATTAGYEL